MLAMRLEGLVRVVHGLDECSSQTVEGKSDATLGVARGTPGPSEGLEQTDQPLSGGRSEILLQQTAESRSARDMAFVVRLFGERAINRCPSPD